MRSCHPEGGIPTGSLHIRQSSGRGSVRVCAPLPVSAPLRRRSGFVMRCCHGRSGTAPSRDVVVMEAGVDPSRWAEGSVRVRAPFTCVDSLRRRPGFVIHCCRVQSRTSPSGMWLSMEARVDPSCWPSRVGMRGCNAPVRTWHRRCLQGSWSVGARESTSWGPLWDRHDADRDALRREATLDIHGARDSERFACDWTVARPPWHEFAPGVGPRVGDAVLVATHCDVRNFACLNTGGMYRASSFQSVGTGR